MKNVHILVRDKNRAINKILREMGREEMERELEDRGFAVHARESNRELAEAIALDRIQFDGN